MSVFWFCFFDFDGARGMKCCLRSEWRVGLFVDLCNWNVMVIMLWSVFFLRVMYKRMHFQADSEYIEVGYVEDFEFFHDGFCM